MIDNRGTQIVVSFKKNEQKGEFTYDLVRNEIIECKDYEEADDEDIYAEIHEWVAENIGWKAKVVYLPTGEELL